MVFAVCHYHYYHQSDHHNDSVFGYHLDCHAMYSSTIVNNSRLWWWWWWCPPCLLIAQTAACQAAMIHKDSHKHRTIGHRWRVDFRSVEPGFPDPDRKPGSTPLTWVKICHDTAQPSLSLPQDRWSSEFAYPKKLSARSFGWFANGIEMDSINHPHMVG